MQLVQMFKRFASGLLMTLMAGSSVQAGVVTVWGEQVAAGVKDNVNNFYNSLPGHSSSIATGQLNTVNLATTNLLWIIQPYDDYTAAELNTMAGFIAAGGRIAFMGEHGTVAPDQNTRINTALSFLGAAIKIINVAVDPNIRSASVADGQILNHPLTAGVSTYEYGWFAPLIVSGNAEALMLGEEPYLNNPSVMMAFQNIGAGSIFVITDQNVWTNASTSWPGGFDNARMFENLLNGNTAVNAPTTSPVTVADLNSSTPTIRWTYFDSEGDIQQKYEVEVWTGPSGTGTKIWDPPIGNGTIASVVYAGSALTPGVLYYARVRASDASGWGNFSETSFIVKEALPSHPLTPVVTENGYINLSVDALGTDNASGGKIQVDKPKSALVRSAYLVGASISAGKLQNGDVSIEGAGVVWLRGIPSSINFWNHWADVTLLVKPKIDASAAGLVDLSVVEKKPGEIDGVILAVIFDDPNQTQRNTVVLFFGAQKLSGDDFYIRFADPIDLSVPNFRLDFSLGISYSIQFNGEPQYSIVDVNGKRLTTAAGGEDDGIADGGGYLITAGGIGDSNNNPVNPNALHENCRSDDELYNLIPFVAQGDTQAHIFTKNPSFDDNICFAALFMSATSIVGEGILLIPVTDTNYTGTTDTLTAKVQNASGTPGNGRQVIFEIVNGPHAGLKDTVVTNSSGNALFIYKGLAIGLDEIVATMKNVTDGLISSNHAYHVWKRTVSNASPTTDPVTISNPDNIAPAIGWTYGDAENDPQTRYEVEVWTGPGATGTSMWDPVVGSGTLTSVTYAGSALVDGQTYYARVRAYDGTSWGAWSEVSWIVDLVTNSAPIADAGPDQTLPVGASCDTVVCLDCMSSTDPDVGASISCSWLLPWGTTTQGYQLTSVVTPGVHEFILTVVDEKGSSDKDTVIVTVTSRTLELGGLSDTAIDEGNLIVRRFTVSDSNGTVPYFSVSDLPAGATFTDSGNGIALLSWNTDCNDHGEYPITLTASDTTEKCMAFTSGLFVLTVRDISFAPEFLPMSDTAASEEQKLTLIVKTRDCDGDSVKIQAISIPSGSTLLDNGNGTATFEWTPDSGDDGDHIAVFEATDNHTAVRDSMLIHITGVTTPQLPAQLSGGYYVDENADGMVDAAYLQFDKDVPVDSMAVSLSWSGAGVPQTGVLSGSSLSYGAAGHTTVRVAIPYASQRANGIKTAGLMSASVQFTAFVNEFRTVEVIDSAAPVIDSATYRIGTSATLVQSTVDTLHVWFSERVRLGTVSAPFTLLRDGATMYSPPLELRSLQDNYAVLIVRGIEGFIGPKNGDSIFINPVSAVGDSLTWQNNPANRRVILKWKPGVVVNIVPINSTGEDPMDITAIKAPFGIKENSGKIIAIDTKVPFDTLRRDEEPVIDENDGKPSFGTAMIYDPVGNLVQNDLNIKKADVGRVFYVLWDGTNRNHRRVSRGVYLIRIAFTIDKNPGWRSNKIILRWR